LIYEFKFDYIFGARVVDLDEDKFTH